MHTFQKTSHTAGMTTSKKTKTIDHQFQHTQSIFTFLTHLSANVVRSVLQLNVYGIIGLLCDC